ncbi:MAG: type II toxin-antitoxin system VapC family toxin [Bacteroidota bacterium]
MIYLIDTHVLLWALENNPKLSNEARSILIDTHNEILISIASLWEISIKLSIDKLELDYPFERLLSEIDKLGFTVIPVSFEALKILRTLPFHHKDPFDRLIITEGIAAGIPIISDDPKFQGYGMEVIWK